MPMPHPAPHHRLLVFVPEGERTPKSVPVELHDPWTTHLLRLLAGFFGGATAYGRGVGVWRNAASEIIWDRVTVVESWIRPDVPDAQMDELWQELEKMRVDLKQDRVGCILDGEWFDSLP